MATWEAGLYLVEFILDNASEFFHKRMIELGSGIGLSGVTMRLFTQAQLIVLTDYLDTVIENMKFNLQLSTTFD